MAARPQPQGGVAAAVDAVAQRATEAWAHMDWSDILAAQPDCSFREPDEWTTKGKG